jgi:hypothetical protein
VTGIVTLPSGVVVAWSSTASGGWLSTVTSTVACWVSVPQVTVSDSGYGPTKVPGGIFNVAVNALATCWSTLSLSELSVPVWLQEPVDPSTVTFPLGGEDAGGDVNAGPSRPFTTRSSTASELISG